MIIFKQMVAKNKINVVNKFEEKELAIENNTDSAIIIQEYESLEFTSSIYLIKILKEIELEMQAMHAKLNGKFLL